MNSTVKLQQMTTAKVNINIQRSLRHEQFYQIWHKSDTNILTDFCQNVLASISKCEATCCDSSDIFPHRESLSSVD